MTPDEKNLTEQSRERGSVTSRITSAVKKHGMMPTTVGPSKVRAARPADMDYFKKMQVCDEAPHTALQGRHGQASDSGQMVRHKYTRRTKSEI